MSADTNIQPNPSTAPSQFPTVAAALDSLSFDALTQLVQQAGETILSFYHREERGVQYKADHSPVTDADKASDTVLRDGLARLCPGIPVISEEAPFPAYEHREHWQAFWLVDPLDGTREFIKKTDDFSINLALVYQNQPIFGLIYIPVTGEVYWGAKDRGAFKQCPNQPPQPLPLVSHPAPPLRVAGKLSSKNGGSATRPLERFVQKLAQPYAGQYQMFPRGASLKFCMLAEGEVHLFPRFGHCSEWDTAAPEVILNEAGYEIRELSQDGDILPTGMAYNKPDVQNPYLVCGKFDDTTLVI